MHVIIILLSVLANLWWIRLITTNISVGIATVASALLIISINKNNRTKILFLFAITTTAFLYVRTTVPRSLTNMNNDDKRIEAVRMRAHPPVYIEIMEKRFWIPTAWWFEGRTESRAVYRFTENVFSSLDLNLYFFASHPRERVGFSEFEKFPYALLPFFMLGIFQLYDKKQKDLGIIALMLLGLIGIYGSNNFLGPFVLFPFISYAVYTGLSAAYFFTKKSYPSLVLPMTGLVVIAVFLVMTQLLLYEI